MEDDSQKEQLLAIAALGTPTDLLHVPLTGALYLHHMGGPDPSTYWSAPEATGDSATVLLSRQRAEFFLLVTAALAPVRLLARPTTTPWQQEFDVAFLFFVKSLAQSATSIHHLTASRCYSDAFSVIRSLHGRVNLLALIGFAPDLFDDWLKSPKDPRFLDGHIRDELANHGIRIYPHFYEHFSEIVHSQYQALEDIGYMETGLFPRISAVENQCLVAAKFLFGVAGWVGVTALRTATRSGIADDLKEIAALFKFLIETPLSPNRFDHLWALTAEERHWKPVGKDKVSVAQLFDFQEYERQFELFHRQARPKELGKSYRRKPKTSKS